MVILLDRGMRAAHLLAAALAFAVAEDDPLECPCGLDKSPWPASPPTTTGELKWLHIPKAGPSFAVTSSTQYEPPGAFSSNLSFVTE